MTFRDDHLLVSTDEVTLASDTLFAYDDFMGTPISRTPKPVIKWLGGKFQMLPVLRGYLPRNFDGYVEPFFGGGAMFFDVWSQRTRLGNPLNRVVLADINPELVNLYTCIRDTPKHLIRVLRDLPNTKAKHDEMKNQNPGELPPVERAARIVFLSKTSFNGLYRVNSRGEFNAAYNYKESVTLCDEPAILAASAALRDVTFLNESFEATLTHHTQPGDLVFCDPPYFPISTTASFVDYTEHGFSPEQQEHLAEIVNWLDTHGRHVIVTNSNHPQVRALYGDRFRIVVYPTRRAVNCDGDSRYDEDVVISSRHLPCPPSPRPESQLSLL